MSSGNQSNPFSNVVSNLLTLGFKECKRLSKKKRQADHLLYPVVLINYLLAQEQYQLILTYYQVAPTYYLQVIVHKPLT